MQLAGTDKCSSAYIEDFPLLHAGSAGFYSKSKRLDCRS